MQAITCGHHTGGNPRFATAGKQNSGYGKAEFKATGNRIQGTEKQNLRYGKQNSRLRETEFRDRIANGNFF